MDIDLGYNTNESTDAVDSVDKNVKESITSIDDDTTQVDSLGNIIQSIDPDEKNKEDIKDSSNKDDNKAKANISSDLVSGTEIDFENNTYIVSENGDLKDKSGNVFKESKDVSEWLKSLDSVTDDSDINNLSIAAIQEAIGVGIVNDDDQPVEFDNSISGIKSYIEAVVETAKEEQHQVAINTIYQKYPFIEDVLNYYTANGNSLEGFGTMPDRSNITIDSNNETQQENIIKDAWEEQGRKGDVNSYIQYLKSSGSLFAVAKSELEGLQEIDKTRQEEINKTAQEQEQANIEKLESYWNGVKEVIDKRSIAGYKIPESILVNRNGQKFSATPTDFFNYIYRVDENGKSAYEKDLIVKSPEDRRNDEILRAYLLYVGGNYSNLVDIAINEKEVNKLRVKSKEKFSTSVRIRKPQIANNGGKVDFGY